MNKSQLRKFAYAIKNLTTIILPRWNEVIEQCAAGSTTQKKLPVHKIPHNVLTRWNSTYDMLKFAFEYSQPINNITGNNSMKIRQYELKDHKWNIVEQLRNCLKVGTIILFSDLSNLPIIDFQNCYTRVFKRVTLHCQRYPSHG